MLGHCWIVQFMIGSLRIPLRKAPIKSQEIRLHHCCLPQPCWWVVSKCSVNICFLTPELNLIWSPPRQPIGNNQASWMRVGSYGRFAFVMDFCLAAKGMGMSSSIQLCTVCLFDRKYLCICTAGLWTDNSSMAVSYFQQTTCLKWWFALPNFFWEGVGGGGQHKKKLYGGRFAANRDQ